jgi:iron(III) transport system substrate-binding protein
MAVNRAVDRRAFLRGAGVLAGGGLAGQLLTACGAAENSANPAAANMTDVAAVSPAEQAMVAAARQEGRLVVYSGTEETIIANLGAAFRERYGVPVEYQRLSSNEIATRYTAEAQAGRTVADLIITGDFELFQIFAGKQWITPLATASVPRLEAWPAEFRDTHTAIVSIIPYSMAINTDRLKTEPSDWSFLHSAEAKGGIVTLDARRVNLVAIAAWDMLLKLYGDDFLRKVGQQQLRLVDSGPSAIQQVGSGAAKVYFPCSLTNANSMVVQGAPVKPVVPANLPYTGVLTQAAISTGAEHPNAARLFLSLLLAESGQKILNVVGSSPVNTPGTPPLPAGFVKPDFVSTAANKAKIIQLLAM